MTDAILVVNAGSSSIKFSVFATARDGSLTPGAHGQVDGIGKASGRAARFEVADGTGRGLIDETIAARDHVGAATEPALPQNRKNGFTQN